MENAHKDKTIMYDDHGIACHEMRVLPTGGSSNILCCYTSYLKEIEFRKERNKTVWQPFDLPRWEDLKVYEPGEADEPINIPCKSCGNTSLPLHTNYQCPNCFKL